MLHEIRQVDFHCCAVPWSAGRCHSNCPALVLASSTSHLQSSSSGKCCLAIRNTEVFQRTFLSNLVRNIDLRLLFFIVLWLHLFCLNKSHIYNIRTKESRGLIWSPLCVAPLECLYLGAIKCWLQIWEPPLQAKVQYRYLKSSGLWSSFS